jgi:carbon storage regulator
MPWYLCFPYSPAIPRTDTSYECFLDSNAYRKEPSMLVLSRQRDESIMIGEKIVVTIVDIRGDKVRLGIEAPGEVPVHRQEVYDAIQRENRQASPLAPE